jgi:hydrogenase-4 component E
VAVVNATTVADTVNTLAIAMVVIGVLLVWTRWPNHVIALVALQSMLLATVGLVTAIHTHRDHLYVGAGLVLGVKGVALPALMVALIRRARANGEMPSAVPRTVGIAAAVVVSLATIETFTGDPFRTALGATRALPAALALILLGLQVMMTRHHVVAQIAGFLVIENGMALAALTATYGMPLVIEFGVLLDLLLAVMVAFVYSRRIHEAHGDLLTTVLRELRG